MILTQNNKIEQILLFLILLLGIAVRINPYHYMINIDEIIPVSVIDGMRLRGDCNTDFSLGVGMPEFFKPFKYNSSGYIVVSRILLDLLHLDNNIHNIRIFNELYFVLSYIFFCLILRKLLVRFAVCDSIGVVFGALLFSLLPGPVFDAWMVRPESLLSLLMVAGLCFVLDGDDKLYTYLSVGFMAGFGVSIKFTFVFFIPLLLYFIYAGRVFSIRPFFYFLLFFIVGFGFGCPYGLLHPDEYSQTIMALKSQYHSHHPPHSLIYPDAARMLLLQGRFFLMVYGFLFVLPFVVSLFAFKMKGSVRMIIVPLLLTFVPLFLYFGTRTVFFERNFHIYFILALIVFVSVLGGLRYSYFRHLSYAMALIPMVYWVYCMHMSKRFDERRRDSMKNYSAFVDVPFSDYGSTLRIAPDRVRLIDYSDEYSERYRRILRDSGYRMVFADLTPFAVLPVNTYMTYLSPNYYYLEKIR